MAWLSASVTASSPGRTKLPGFEFDDTAATGMLRELAKPASTRATAPRPVASFATVSAFWSDEPAAMAPGNTYHCESGGPGKLSHCWRAGTEPTNLFHTSGARLWQYSPKM